jgi:hypothetical protein
MSNDISAVLAERGSRYGRFDAHALLTQQIKLTFSFGRNWDNLPVDSKEALEMIAHKIGRILNGDPEYADSWTDIAGYSKLVADRLLGEGEYKIAELGSHSDGDERVSGYQFTFDFSKGEGTTERNGEVPASSL